MAGPGGVEPVPRADSWSFESQLLLCPLPAATRSSADQANPDSREKEVWWLRSISKGPEGSQQEAERRLAVPGSQVQLSSILGDNIYNVPSPRIIPPACPPSVFPADGFSRLLNNWLGSGARKLTECCLLVPSLFSRAARLLAGSPHGSSTGEAKRVVRNLEAKRGGDGKCQRSGTEVCRQLTCFCASLPLKDQITEGENAC